VKNNFVRSPTIAKQKKKRNKRKRRNMTVKMQPTNMVKQIKDLEHGTFLAWHEQFLRELKHILK
jgi:hypothetical protein